MCLEIIYSIYMYKEYLALNNLQWLICHKTQPNQIIYILIYMYKEYMALNNPQWLICHENQPTINDVLSMLPLKQTLITKQIFVSIFYMYYNYYL